jgi:hypothetical protein
MPTRKRAAFATLLALLPFLACACAHADNAATDSSAGNQPCASLYEAEETICKDENDPSGINCSDACIRAAGAYCNCQRADAEKHSMELSGCFPRRCIGRNPKLAPDNAPPYYDGPN